MTWVGLSAPTRGGLTMNWDAIAAIGQAVSALALVLVVQLSYARAEMSRTVTQARTDDAVDLMSFRGGDENGRLTFGKMRAALELPDHPFVPVLARKKPLLSSTRSSRAGIG